MSITLVKCGYFKFKCREIKSNVDAEGGFRERASALLFKQPFL